MSGEFPSELRYTESDEWVRLEGDEVICGVTTFASEQLGDVVYLQLPEVGTQLTKDQPFGEIESVKAVSDLFAPLAGEVIAVNTELDDNPGLVNEDVYGAGWIVRLRLENKDDYDSLLDPEAYRQSTLERA